MQVLVVGGGGREHALAWKISQSSAVSRVYVAPGNAGTSREPGLCNVPLDSDNLHGLLDFARGENIALTIVGPEVPLVAGIVDRFHHAGLRIFGPTAAAAQLEGSKAFCKHFLTRHHIPTARYRAFDNLAAAIAHVGTMALPIVVKADGLAAGKGVIIADTYDQANAAVTDMLADNRFGAAGRRVVIEEFLQGEEASFTCMVAGDNILPLASSQDHKARDEGDTGPNTGGMGACTPTPVIDDAMHAQIMDRVIRPTVVGMRADGHPFCGFLYAGLMIGADGSARVLEFNVRLGDPETQPIMMRLQGDLASACLAACDGQLDHAALTWDPRPAVGVVMAASGYPGSYAKGTTIHGLNATADRDTVKVFHAGTANDDRNNAVVTTGGRVLCVVGLGDDIAKAQQTAYSQVGKIHWEGVYYRRDIGHRAIAEGVGNA